MDVVGILIAVGAAAVVAFTIIYNIVRAKQGKSSCSCPGKSSSFCAGCTKYKQPDKSDAQ